MARRRRGLLAALTAACLTLGVGSCAHVEDIDGRAGDRGAVEIGLLLPDHLGRWEHFDRPDIEQGVATLCPDCTVTTANAQGDIATQQQQMDSMITQGVDALLLIPVDAAAISAAVERADEAGVPVIAYDRLADGPVSAYISFDNLQVGRLQGHALLRAMGISPPDAPEVATEGGGDDDARSDQRPEIIMVNGAPNDPNAALFAQGALEVLGDEVRIVATHDTFAWSRDDAYAHMAGAIADLGPDRFDGVYAANDSLAAGVIAALKAARVRPPPITGQDAELTAIQRIIAGEQYMTVYKPFHLEARPAASMALALARGQSIEAITRHTVSNDTVRGIPALLANPVAVTRALVEHTVVKDGLYTVEEICTPELESACARAGLTA
ncbi:sugar ABC transporter substrate-binding protein [Streptomyces sp. 4N509B]|uniref:sugar ABC transporter substrate-binding protein n=1 Tax=Streptomyces sp. 4N509B TaxID=3457413 RepID=UPI003FD064C0